MIYAEFPAGMRSKHKIHIKFKGCKDKKKGHEGIVSCNQRLSVVFILCEHPFHQNTEKKNYLVN